MEERDPNPFAAPAEQRVANHFKLVIAHRLKRIWADVVQEPIPPDLQLLLQRLESAPGLERSEPRASEETTGP
jgi:hypothetical protein